MNKLAWLIGTLALGCATQTPAPTEAARQLGIDHYEVQHSATSLVIEGLDVKGTVIGRAALKLGRFTMEDEGDVTDGRQLDINVDGKSAHHESRGFKPLKLPLNGRSAEIRAFLQDPLVSQPLLAWGVGFDTTGQAIAPRPAETPYELNCQDPWSLMIIGSNPYPYSGGCTYGSNCSNTECVQFDKGGGEYGEFVCCYDGGKASERACTSAFSSSSCGGTGGLGCAPCWDNPENGCHTQGDGSYVSIHWCGM